MFPFASEQDNWRGVLIEPVPYLYKRLRKNYGESERLTFLNLAISDHSGELPFFSVDPAVQEANAAIPSWSQGIGGFDHDHIVRMLGHEITPFIREISVPSLTVAELLSQFPERRFDLLHIDTEGFDYKILKQFFQCASLPHTILVEYCHLTYWETLAMILRLQSTHQLYRDDCDLLAIRKS